MIDVKDLKIGNIVGHKYSNSEIKPYYVLGLLDKASISLDLKDVLKCDYDLLEPIPLNEGWLINFGFSDKNYKQGFIGKDFKSGRLILDFLLNKPFTRNKYNKNYTFDFKEYNFIPFEFVHELQNFFRCVTGCDLHPLSKKDLF